jgi:hypothetical protein
MLALCLGLGMACGRLWLAWRDALFRHSALHAQLAQQVAERQIDEVTRTALRLMDAEVNRPGSVSAPGST